MIKIEIPPVVQITEDMVEVSKQLRPSDVGRWAVVLPNGFTFCNDKHEALFIQEELTKILTDK